MDAEAFKRIFLPYHQKMYRVAYRIVQNAANAEDIIQDTFIKLWNKRSELDSVDNREAFAIIILRNTCLDYLRKVKNEYHVYDNDIPIPEAGSLSNEIEIKDNVNQVKHFINQLPEQQRQVMIMKHWEGYSDEEIEQITGYTQVNIRVMLSRARKTVRERFLKLEVGYGNG